MISAILCDFASAGFEIPYPLSEIVYDILNGTVKYGNSNLFGQNYFCIFFHFS